MALSEEQREKRRQQMRALNAAKTPEQRTAAGRKGGQATYAKVGKAGMSELGKKGFARALETVGGHTLYEILGASYRAKYGRDPVRLLSKEEMQRRTRIRAQARRQVEAAACFDASSSPCGGALERDHVRGLHAPDPNAHVEIRCHSHHVERHRSEMAAKRGEKR